MQLRYDGQQEIVGGVGAQFTDGLTGSSFVLAVGADVIEEMEKRRAVFAEAEAARVGPERYELTPAGKQAVLEGRVE